MTEKLLEIIEQEHKVHLALQDLKAKLEPQVPQGIQGPPGITQINETNYYSVEGNTSSIPPNDFVATSTAECDMGDVAISGEYGIFGTPVVQAFASLGTPPDSWQTIISGVPNEIVQTTVNCFDNPPLR